MTHQLQRIASSYLIDQRREEVYAARSLAMRREALAQLNEAVALEAQGVRDAKSRKLAEQRAMLMAQEEQQAQARSAAAAASASDAERLRAEEVERMALVARGREALLRKYGERMERLNRRIRAMQPQPPPPQSPPRPPQQPQVEEEPPPVVVGLPVGEPLEAIATPTPQPPPPPPPPHRHRHRHPSSQTIRRWLARAPAPPHPYRRWGKAPPVTHTRGMLWRRSAGRGLTAAITAGRGRTTYRCALHLERLRHRRCRPPS